MSKINILTKDIYNKIAAGEVVEKPASVVKELVENSIDAGATNISIDIISGGISKIRVSDNGSGIELEDFDKVFLAHATSKVKTLEDLNSIGTLGFRGEALSSIASVSNVTLASKVETCGEGYQVHVQGGEMGEILPIGATTGTYIIVEDLFFNIPARKKFLRKPKLEENDITNYVARLILANPNISFKYTADNKIVYQSFGTGLYDAIYSIYGKSIVDNIIEVNFSKGDFHFNGYLGKPTFSKPNRTYQTLIINGRYVINQTVSTAIFKAYENFMMKGNFPFFVLNLEIPLDKVDVNVHPNKLEVKFEDSNSVFGIVYSEIAQILYSINNTKKVVLDEAEDYLDTSKLVTIKNDEGSQYSPKNTENDNEEIKEVSLASNIEYEVNKTEQELEELKNNIQNISNDNVIIPYSSTSSLTFKIAQNKELISEGYASNEISYEPRLEQSSLVNDISINNNNGSQPNNQSTFIKNAHKIIGTIFDTYIIVEIENRLLLIDQHAGHERLLYDKFTRELENKEVAIQPLIIPYILESNYMEANFINDNIEIIRDLGFDIEEFGANSFKVSTIPLLFENVSVDQIFDEILSDIDNKLVLSKSATIKDYIAKKSCKSAVKGNTHLSDNEICELVNRLTEPNQVLLCPHGRPIMVELEKKDIEKWFKRIV